MTFEERIDELFIDLPEPAVEAENFVQVSKVGKLVYLSGQLPYAEGRLGYKGRVGLELTLDAGKAAARAAIIQALGVLQKNLGSVNKIKKVVHAKLYIATGADFKDHKKVAAGGLELFQEIFGASGKPSLDVMGCTSLPEGAAVQLSLVVEVK
jgi:enamine deaminase RidA (YjgF/YER057c/UK114 family)